MKSEFEHIAEMRRMLWTHIGVITVVGVLGAIAMIGMAHAQALPLPTPDQLHTSVTETETAYHAVVRAWASYGWLWPLLAALPAFSKRIQEVPVVGQILNAIAFNFGAAKNVK